MRASEPAPTTTRRGARRGAIRIAAVALAAIGCSPTATAPAAKPARHAAAPASVAPKSVAPPSAKAATAEEGAAPERGAARRTVTVGAATALVPAGWTATSRERVTVLHGPEPELRLAIVDGGDAAPDDAVRAAWQVVDAPRSRPPKLVQQATAREGWDERRVYDYETSPDERLEMFAIAFRRGARWAVVLVDGDRGAFQRRSSDVRLVLGSTRPGDYARESFAGKKARPLDAAGVRALVGFVDRARAAAHVPGAALAIVDKDRVLFEGGFGVRELGRPEPIDADTLFLVASNTKALTTLMLAKLVDEKRFGWDTPVVDVLPSFALGDAATTRAVRMKHLVCACTGMPRQDFEWLFEFAGQTPASEMALLGTMQPTTRFGETFQYSNPLAAAAGFVGGHAAYPDRELGAAYDEAMRTRVFEPLGMRATTFDFARALRASHASPHGEDVDARTVVASMAPNASIVPLRPAGGAWSTARDLGRALQMELGRGLLPDGRRFIGEEALLARRVPQVVIGEDASYAMGLVVEAKHGVPVVQHDGSMMGYKSFVFFLPEQGIGVALLTNAEDGWMLERPLLRRTLELLFDGRPEADEDFATSLRRVREARAKERARLRVPADRAVVARLATRYVSDALGPVTVRVGRDGGVALDFGEWQSAVASRANDDGTVSLQTIDPGVEAYTFVVAERQGRRALVLRDPQHQYVFEEAR